MQLACERGESRLALVGRRSGRPEQTYFTFCYSSIRDDEGQVAGFLDTVIETTVKVRAEQRSKRINNELAHRIQNTLTIVNCVADQTFRNASSVTEARATLSRRIKALAQAHDVLTHSNWNRAPLDAVVAGALVRIWARSAKSAPKVLHSIYPPGRR